MPKLTHHLLFAMRKRIFEQLRCRTVSRSQAAELLHMHPNAVSRLFTRYKEHGASVLLGQKPGPKCGAPDNKTPELIEETVCRLADAHPELGTLPLAERLVEQGIHLNQSTVWRILKRRKVRYVTTYTRWKQAPKLYCLDEPGIELQLDGSYPYGRSRKVVCYDSIDDCSRFVFGKCYAGVESDELAVQYVSELIQRTPFRIQRLRVDNRYGKRFEEYCRSVGITVIRNDPYSPEQNGKIERFHRTAKREFFWKVLPNLTIEELNYQLSLWLKYYNYIRKHGGYGMDRLTPAEKLTKTYLALLGQADLQKVTGILQQYISLSFILYPLS